MEDSSESTNICLAVQRLLCETVSLWNVICFPVSVFSAMLDFLRYRLLPPLMIIFFTGITQYLVSLGNPHRFWRQPLDLGSTYVSSQGLVCSGDSLLIGNFCMSSQGLVSKQSLESRQHLLMACCGNRYPSIVKASHVFVFRRQYSSSGVTSPSLSPQKSFLAR